MTTIVTPASATLDTTRSPACLRIAGDWTLANYTPLKRSTEALHGQYDAGAQVDLATAMTHCKAIPIKEFAAY